MSVRVLFHSFEDEKKIGRKERRKEEGRKGERDGEREAGQLFKPDLVSL